MTDLPLGKLDDLSVKIGQLIEGQRAIDKYTHDHMHDLANVSSKVDGLGMAIGKQLDDLEARVNRQIMDVANQLRSESTAQIASLTTQLATANVKIAVLEGNEYRRDGAVGVVRGIFQSPALGWLVGAAISAWAILTGKVHV